MRISDWSSDVCRSSLLTYGISDYSSLSLLSPHDRDGIRRSLERAIALPEKRLTRVRVALQQQRPYERALRFHVDGLLDLGPEHEQVRFDAGVPLATQGMWGGGRERFHA